MTGAVTEDAEASINPSTPCASCGHAYREHASGASCRHRDDDGLCGCSLFQTQALRESLIVTAAAALEAARTRDRFVRSLESGHGMLPVTPIPAPIGANCPDHPTYPLVIRGEEAWCRAGQHVAPTTVG